MRKWVVLTPLLTVGFHVAFSLLIPTIIGWRIGIRVHHELLFPLLGLGLGTVIMVYGLYRIVRPFLQEAEWSEEDREQLRQPVRIFLNLLFPGKKKGREK